MVTKYKSAFSEFYEEDNRDYVLEKIDQSLKLLANLKKLDFIALITLKYDQKKRNF